MNEFINTNIVILSYQQNPEMILQSLKEYGNTEYIEFLKNVVPN